MTPDATVNSNIAFYLILNRIQGRIRSGGQEPCRAHEGGQTVRARRHLQVVGKDRYHRFVGGRMGALVSP